MDFATNASLLRELREQINNAINNINLEEAYIFNGIENLCAYWTGQSYDTFRDKCRSYKPAMDSLVKILEAYRDMLDNVIDDSEKLVGDIATQLNV